METRPPKQYWSITEGVFNCLLDEERTRAFGEAIQSAVHEGNVVVDMGSGSGILALLAARAGASKVYAVEFDPNNVQRLAGIFEENGYGSIIEVIHGDATSVDLPEKVDVIVGEMIATGLVEELQVQANNNMLRFAKPEARIVLARYESFIDLVWQQNEYSDFVFNVVRYEYEGDSTLVSTVLTEPHLYSNVDFTKQVTDRKVDVSHLFTIKKSGTINGLRISSRTVFSDGSDFTYSFAYSYPIILPLPVREVRDGETISVSLSYELCGGFNTLKYSVV